MAGRFGKYNSDLVIKVADEELRLKRVKTEKLQKLLSLTKDEDNMLINLVAYFTDIVSSNYPDENKDEIESFVQANVMTIFEEFQIAYGLIKRADLEKRKAELIAKQGA
jgi:hypothetical protein